MHQTDKSRLAATVAALLIPVACFAVWLARYVAMYGGTP